MSIVSCISAFCAISGFCAFLHCYAFVHGFRSNNSNAGIGLCEDIMFTEGVGTILVRVLANTTSSF